MSFRAHYAHWTDEMLARARALKAEGKRPMEIDVILGIPKGCTSRKFCRERENERNRARGMLRKTRQEVIGNAGSGRHDPPEAASEDANARAATPRTLTAILCGDPAPGWSALDRCPQAAVKPIDSRGTSES